MMIIALLALSLAPCSWAQEEQRIISELQTWGVPPELRVFYLYPKGEGGEASLRPQPGAFQQSRLVLYDLARSSPSPAGRKLHELLSGLRAEELARINEEQLQEALRLIEQGTWRSESDIRPPVSPALARAYEERAAEVLSRPGGRGPALGWRRQARALRELLLEQGSVLRARLRALREAGGPARDIDRLQEALTAIAFLSGAKPGLLTHAALHTLVAEIPERTFTPAQWDALARAFPLGESVSRLGLPALWRRGITGRGVRVAVIDGGVDACHPDLEGYVREGGNFSRQRYRDGSRAGQPDPRDRHGTHVAGIIHGLAPGVEILNYKVMDPEDCRAMPGELQMGELQMVQAVADAMELAAREAEQDGARLVLNLSLGFGSRNHLIAADPLVKKVAELAELGVIVVAASGNGGGGHVGTPGYSPRAVTVGSAGYSGRQAPTSSRQEVLEISPDGRGRLVIKPDILAYGVDIRSARFDPRFAGESGSEYVDMSGTSMAAPHVSAVVAMLLEAGREQGIELGVEDVRELLLATAAEARDAPYGRGIVNPQAACRQLDMAGNLVFFNSSCPRARAGR